MKQFFTNLISSSSDQSSKRALLIFFAIILAICCLWATYKGEYFLVIPTLAGLVITLAGINSSENKKKITVNQKKQNE